MPLDPNISLGVKPVDFLGTASNLLNMARGAQAFQQEQQMNPLQLEQARINIGKTGLDLNTLQQTQKEEIERLKALSKTTVNQAERSQIDLEIARKTQESDILQKLAQSQTSQSQARGAAVQARIAETTEPADIARILANSGLAVTQENIAKIQLQVAQGTALSDIARNLASTSTTVTGAETAKFAQAGQIEGTLRQTLNPLYRQDWIANAVKNPQQAINDIRLSTERAVAAGVPIEQAEAYKASMYSVLADAKKSNNPALLQNWMFNNLMSQQAPPQQQQLLAPAGAPNIDAGGVPGFGIATPSGPGFRPLSLESGAPTAPAAPAAPARPSMGQPSGVTQGALQMPPMRYPSRVQGSPAILVPGEREDFAAGREYVNKLTALQPAMATSKRDIQEVVSKADEIAKKLKAPSFQSGYIGTIERNVREKVMGDSDYQQLSKDLARLQLSTMAAQGSSLNTDAGKDLAAQANGTVTYAPEVIMSQARKTYAGILATEAEGQAAELFRQRYGEANHNAFKQTWSKNSNNRVFELMGLQDLVPDPAEQERITKEVILKGMTPKQIDDLTKQYRNIKRLRETGSL
jgi:hypothetical protein